MKINLKLLFACAILVVGTSSLLSQEKSSPTTPAKQTPSPKAKSAATNASVSDFPIIGYIEKRDRTITIKSGAKETIYSVKAADGKVLCNNLTLEQLRAQSPELHEFVNADEIARGLSPFDPDIHAVAAGKIMIERIDTLLDGIIAKGGCEFVAEFAKVLPATIFLDLVGLPRERADEFLKWADVSLCAPTPQERIAAMVCIRDYLASEIECRQKDPRNDILSALTNGEIDGRRLEFREALGGAMVLYIAGLDTVAGQLGWIFRHLAEDTELQMSLRRDPSRLAKVNEEFIRFFSSVCFSRRATKDVEIGGVTVRKGDSVTCSTTMCGRDSTEFKDADRLDVSQQPRRHMAFGFGIHNCIGLHLARLEINLATERWLERVPEFRIAEGASTPSHGGSFIALDSLPIVCRGTSSRRIAAHGGKS